MWNSLRLVIFELIKMAFYSTLCTKSLINKEQEMVYKCLYYLFDISKWIKSFDWKKTKTTTAQRSQNKREKAVTL